MWDNYYDRVQYEESTEQLDDIGDKVYKESRLVDCRYVSGGSEQVISKESSSIKYTKEYHFPFEIKEGDKIDGRMVVSVDANKDVFGHVHFYIVKVL